MKKLKSIYFASFKMLHITPFAGFLCKRILFVLVSAFSYSLLEPVLRKLYGLYLPITIIALIPFFYSFSALFVGFFKHVSNIFIQNSLILTDLLSISAFCVFFLFDDKYVWLIALLDGSSVVIWGMISTVYRTRLYEFVRVEAGNLQQEFQITFEVLQNIGFFVGGLLAVVISYFGGLKILAISGVIILIISSCCNFLLFREFMRMVKTDEYKEKEKRLNDLFDKKI